MKKQNVRCCQGMDAVHGLFDFLQNRPHDKDVPQLIAPCPFVNSTLKKLRVKNSRAVQVSVLYSM
jgi:hypothetical protein